MTPVGRRLEAALRVGGDAVVIPLFDAAGSLPAGRYPATIDEVEQSFVIPFAASLTRADLFAGWKRLRQEIRAIVPVEMEWIDGSFVTAKLDPGDIDVVSFIRADALGTLSMPDRQQLLPLVQGPASKPTHRCDSYLVAVFALGHPLEGQYLRERGYWDRQWSRDRTRPEKGYIDVRDTP